MALGEEPGRSRIRSRNGLPKPVLGRIGKKWVLSYRLLDGSRDAGSRLYLVSLIWALTALTRPDGVLFAFAAAAGWVLASNFTKPALMTAWKLLVLPIVFVLLHVGFRQLYYDDWVPHTYYAKIAFNASRIIQGARYVAANCGRRDAAPPWWPDLRRSLPGPTSP